MTRRTLKTKLYSVKVRSADLVEEMVKLEHDKIELRGIYKETCKKGGEEYGPTNKKKRTIKNQIKLISIIKNIHRIQNTTTKNMEE